MRLGNPGKKVWLSAAGIAAVLLITGLTWILNARGARSDIHEIRAQKLIFRVKASGELASSASLSIGPPVIPRVWDFTVTFLAPEGRPVNQGEPLVGFDTKALRDRLQVQQSELATAEKELEKITLEEQERLDGLLLEQADVGRLAEQTRQKLDVPEDMYARLELEKLRLDWDLVQDQKKLNAAQIEVQKTNLEGSVQAAQNKVTRLRSQVEETTDSIRRMTVTAPRAGFVVYVPDWNGRKTVVGENVWFGRTILEVADLSKMQVNAVIPEPDAALVRPGQRVEIRLDANPDKLFRGQVISLGKIFRAKSWDKPSVVFDARVSIENPDPDLMRPGMAADVVVLAEAEQAVPVVPEEAVTFTTEGPQVSVIGRKERAPVKLGRRSPPLVEILEGVRAGESVRIPEGILSGGEAR